MVIISGYDFAKQRLIYGFFES